VNRSAFQSLCLGDYALILMHSAGVSSALHEQTISLSRGHPNSSKNDNTTPLDQPKPVCKRCPWDWIRQGNSRLLWTYHSPKNSHMIMVMY